MLLYPRLPLSLATTLADERSSRPIHELCRISQDINIQAAWYSPTGGNRVKPEALRDLQQKIRAIAMDCAYPSAPSEAGGRHFDQKCVEALYTKMGIAPSEASSIGVWTYMTCVLLPDIVRWRFPGDERTATERFIGSDRGQRRNTFGRLWWRAHLFHDPNAPDPFFLVGALTEDELVQVTERPTLAASRVLAKQLSRSFLETIELRPMLPRRGLIRDAVKRIRRLLPLISFDSLDDQVLHTLIDGVMLEAAGALD
jgi:hypothetical protein